MAANRKPLVDGPDISNPMRTSVTAITGLVVTPTSLQNLGLNYFDGRFLRADDLNLERAAQRAYVDVGRRAGGQGIGDGLNLEASGTQLRLSGGTAIDFGGRLVSLDGIGWTEFAAVVSSAASPASSLSAPAAGAYVVRIAREPQLAGNADVLGRVCDCGCGSIMDKPIAVDGVRIWADQLPTLLLPSLPGVTDPVKHARSQIASAYFSYERDRLWTPLSGPGLALATWCAGESVNTDSGAGANRVDIGVIYWNGSSVSWYDDWTVRRELMETRPKRYWEGLTEERPWSVFMAQVLQFQCQLAEEPAVSRPASAGQDAIQRAAAAATGGFLSAGFVELPSAAYVPIVPSSASTLRADLETLFGSGIDLRICAVRRDQIAHEFERAQHMDRISLLRGLTDPADRQFVDILVPDGVVEASTVELTSHGFTVDVTVGDASIVPAGPMAAAAVSNTKQLLLQGVGRFDHTSGMTVRAAVGTTDSDSVRGVMSVFSDLSRGEVSLGAAVDQMHALSFGNESPARDLLRQYGQETAEAAAIHRASRKRSRFVNIPGARSRVAATAVTCWVAMDPFAMADHEEVPFRATWDIVMPRATTLGNSVKAAGGLKRDHGSADSDGEKVFVVVAGLLTVTGTSVPGGSVTIPFDRPLVLTRSRTGSEGTFTVMDSETALTASVRWQGTPIEASGGIGQPSGIGAANPTFEDSTLMARALAGRPISDPKVRSGIFATFEATENAAIYQPGNPYRDTAISALQLLSGLQPDNASYFDDAYAELFPDAGFETGRSLIRPVYDWVLFRRRRREDCEGTSIVTPQAVASVAAWVARASDKEQAERYRSLLREGSGAVPWSPTAVEIVKFDEGSATMRSSAVTWREKYDAARGGDALVFAGYAKSALSTEMPAGILRAKALVAATSPLATMDADGVFDLVPHAPAAQMMSDTEGSIFLISYPIDSIEVLAVDGINRSDLAAQLKEGNVEAVGSVPGEAFTYLGRTGQSGSLSQGTVDEVLGALSNLAGSLAETHDIEATAQSAVVWTHEGLGGEALSAVQARAARILSSLSVAENSTDTKTGVAFEPDQGEAARIYIVISESRP
jgi:hypothetical protein